MTWTIYRVIAPLLGTIAPAARVFASRLERPLWSERMGRAEVEPGADAWIHAASLGEALAVGPLVRELSRLQPDARLHLTATTRTGRDRLRALHPRASLAPIDAPQAIRRFLDALRPARLFIVETEIWPHWLLHARARGIPVAVVSARLSARSVSRYRRLGRDLRRLVEELGAVLCQTGDDRDRWLALGATPARVEVVGNLKNDALPEPAADRGIARGELGLDPERPLLVLGSVRPGEVRFLAQAWQRLPRALRERWQVAALPRHPAMADPLRTEAVRAGQAVVGEGAPAGGAWRWDPRLGMLHAYYAAADAAFVGGSLAPYGGHNPLEPAACGAAVLMGPHHESQTGAVHALLGRGAIRIATAGEDLAVALELTLGDDAERSACARAALSVAREQRGAARRAAEGLRERGLWPIR